MSIILAGYVFSGPKSVKDYMDEDARDVIDGIYGIFYLKNPEKKVADFGILYLGDTEEIKAEGFPATHKKYTNWVEGAKSEENLFVGICPTPGLMPKKKELIYRHLLYKYNPPCNR